MAIAATTTVQSSLPTTAHVTSAQGDQTMVVVTSGAAAVPGLIEKLDTGAFTAMDAALSCAFSQIVHCAGSWVSAAGIISAAHYDPSTGVVDILDAGFDLPLEETDPWSIPPTGRPSGRATLTPGFPAGAQAAHDRYGAASWEIILAPAISTAEDGLEIGDAIGSLLNFRKDTMLASESARQIFAPEGTLLKKGEILRQEAFAGWLHTAAQSGPGTHMTGKWGQSLVNAVQQSGGKLSEADLHAYRAEWRMPISHDYAHAQLFASGPPQLSGVCLFDALSQIGDGTMQRLGHYSTTPEALVRLVRASHQCYVRFLGGAAQAAPNEAASEIPLVDRLAGPSSNSPHSDVVLTVDRDGRVTVLCHSINTTAWGTTGLFVDGVSIPDSAAFQQPLLSRIAPGGRVPNALSPVIAKTSDDGLLAMGAIGGSVAETMLQSTVNILDFGHSAQQAASAPMVLSAVWPGIGAFQLLFFAVAAVILTPVCLLSLAMISEAPLSFSVLALVSVLNLGFGVAVYSAWRHRCRKCLQSIDHPILFFVLAAAAFVAAFSLLFASELSTWIGLLAMLGAVTSLVFVPVLRGSLVPVNLMEPGSFSDDHLTKARKAGLAFREISADPPYGYWAGARIGKTGIEAAVSPKSLDGTAIGR